MAEEDLFENAHQQLVHVVLQPGARLDELGVVAARQVLALCARIKKGKCVKGGYMLMIFYNIES